MTLSVGVWLTIATGFVVGYGAIWLQFFGDSPDREDYQVSSGGYAAAAVVLAFAVAALLGHRGPRWVTASALLFAALYALLAATSARDATRSADPGPGISNAFDGVGGVLAMPWTWPLVVLGVTGAVRLGAGRLGRADEHARESLRR